MDIQFSTIRSHVLPTSVKQDTLEVHPDFRRLQVGNKDLGAGVGSVRCPLGGFGKGEQLRPVRQRGEDFERLGQRTGFVPRQEETNSRRLVTVSDSPTIHHDLLGVHLDDLGVQPLSRIGRSLILDQLGLDICLEPPRLTLLVNTLGHRSALHLAENQIGQRLSAFSVGGGRQRVQRSVILGIDLLSVSGRSQTKKTVLRLPSRHTPPLLRRCPHPHRRPRRPSPPASASAA